MQNGENGPVAGWWLDQVAGGGWKKEEKPTASQTACIDQEEENKRQKNGENRKEELALPQFQLQLRSALDAGTSPGYTKVFILRMCRMDMAAWKLLEVKFGEGIRENIISLADQVEDIRLHMEAVGVWMHPVISNERKEQHRKNTYNRCRLFWEQRKSFHLVVTKPFMENVLETLSQIPSKMRAAPREIGEFNIRDYNWEKKGADEQVYNWGRIIGELWAEEG